jgi:predicted transglutaminase-like cysteine proteinase
MTPRDKRASAHKRLTPLFGGINMLTRVATCAALFLLSPICSGIDGSSASPRPQGAAFGAQQPVPDEPRQEPDTPVENQTTSQRAAYVAAPIARAEPADTRAAISLERQIESSRSRESEPFGLDVEPLAAGDILTKWHGVKADIRADDEVLARCRAGASCPSAARRFLAIIDEGRAQQNGRARIGIINRAINLAIIPTSDLAQWGVADRWSAPLETFTTRRGDCEDYAIAKYVALRAAGVAKEDVKLVVVRDIAAEENHAMAAVRLDGEWIILDNRSLVLVRDSEMLRATPLLVLDDNGVRQFVAAGSIAKLQETAPGSF